MLLYSLSINKSLSYKKEAHATGYSNYSRRQAPRVWQINSRASDCIGGAQRARKDIQVTESYYKTISIEDVRREERLERNKERLLR